MNHNVVRCIAVYNIVTCADMWLLVRGEGHKLADCQLIDGTTITVCVRLLGGPGRLQPIPGVIDVTSQQPDMITLDNSPTELRAIMPCGHVISEEAFTICCSYLVEAECCVVTVAVVVLITENHMTLLCPF